MIQDGSQTPDPGDDSVITSRDGSHAAVSDPQHINRIAELELGRYNFYLGISAAHSRLVESLSGGPGESSNLEHNI